MKPCSSWHKISAKEREGTQWKSCISCGKKWCCQSLATIKTIHSELDSLCYEPDREYFDPLFQIHQWNTVTLGPCKFHCISSLFPILFDYKVTKKEYVLPKWIGGKRQVLRKMILQISYSNMLVEFSSKKNAWCTLFQDAKSP